MPELTELLATVESCHYSIDHLEKKTGRKIWGSPLQQIYYDPSSQERRAASKASSHFVKELTEDLAPSIIRGSAKVNQTPLWPRVPETCPTLDDLAKPRSEREPYQFMPRGELSKLTLQDVTGTPRTLIINFGVMLAQVWFIINTLLCYVFSLNPHSSADVRFALIFISSCSSCSIPPFKSTQQINGRISRKHRFP